jgi:nucleoside-diphosphate-sugar epimerase
METVLITGAGGYIGSNAAEYFAQAGYRVVGTVRRTVAPRFRQLGVTTIPADLTDAAALPRLFAERPDYIVHIAGRASDVGRDDWFREANYETVKRLADAARAHGVKRFVFLSTADVYGLYDFHGESEDELPFDERATNPYPRYKILAEKWLAANLPRECFSCVRPGIVYGRGDTTITPRTVAYLKHTPIVFYFGKWRGRNRWPLAHVENVCRTIHAAMILPEAGGRGVTVLDSRRTTLRGYYHEIARTLLDGRRLRECTIPTALARPIAGLSTLLSRNRPTPLFDPTLYALTTVTRNLDFSNRRMCAWLAAAGLEEYVTPSPFA